MSTGKLLFVAPRNRTLASFLQESREHGWPSFRDEEVVAEHVRVLRDGETVSVDPNPSHSPSLALAQHA